jgi:pseudaminic acid synthase
MKKGEIFTKENIRSIRPGQGISPKYYESILGKRSSEALMRGQPLTKNDIE